jgi:uncharacterized membrane protein YhaH (DUF805 family)
MRFGEAIETCLRKSVIFSGRASRSEFWWVALAWSPIAAAAFLWLKPRALTEWHLYGVYALRVVACLPLLSVAARRAEDASFNQRWIGWGFSGVLFSVGMDEIFKLAPYAAPTAGMNPVSVVLLIASGATLLYVLTRSSRLDSDHIEVTR